ncbi:hypothetical protein ACOME3_001250 [Neoechinorhynchus agilis]
MTVVKKRSNRKKVKGKNKMAGKYWHKRYILFKRFDEGIRLVDRESWYSTTEEQSSLKIIEECPPDALCIDGYCGAGSLAIQYTSQNNGFVLAIDIIPRRAAMCAHNAQIYGVKNRIDVICADFQSSCLRPGLADIVFISAPWGGPKYREKLTCTGVPESYSDIVRFSQTLATNTVVLLPGMASEDYMQSLDRTNSFKLIDCKGTSKKKVIMRVAFYGSFAKH